MNVRMVLIGALFITTAYLSLVRLDEPALWNDESHVALFARNFSQTGHWTAWDGRNLAGADRNGRYLDDRLRTVLPQLDFAIAAASFRLFGVSTWSARILFALAGIGAVALLHIWMKIEMPEGAALRLYAVAALGLSAQYLLYIRTCRYYSVAALLILVCLIGCSKFLQTKNWRWLAMLAVAAALLFYASALCCGAFLLALAVRHFVFDRRKCSKRDWLLFCGCGAVFLLLILPYAFACILPYTASSKMDFAGQGAEVPWIESRLTLLWWNIRELNATNAMPWMVAAGLGVLFLEARDKRSKKERLTLAGWASLAGVYVIGIALLSPQPIQLTQIADVRYISPILPLFAALAGSVLAAIHRKSAAFAGVVLAVLLTTTLLGAWPDGWTFRWLLPAFVEEIHTPFPTACGEIARYLREHARKDDDVFILPEFFQNPVQFHAGDQILIRGLLNRNTHLSAAEIDRLDPTLFVDQVFPEWIISCGMQPELNSVVNFFSRSHTRNGETTAFRYAIAAVLPVYWNETQRPELPWHTFGPNRDFNKNSEAVYVLKRTETNPSLDGR